jgi:phosphoribosylformylglycinamidine synthase
MVGLLERVDRRVPSHFAMAGDDVLILGTTRGELGGSAYWSEIREFVGGRTPPVDLEAERRLQEFLVEAARRGFLRSAHDAAEGGLLVTLAEAAIGGAYAASGLGAALDLEGYAPGVDLEALLYGEDAGRVVLSADPANSAALAELARERPVPLFRAGRVGGRTLELRVRSRVFSWDVETLRRTYFEAIPRRMQHADAERSAGE